MQKYGLLQNIFSNRFQPSLPAKHRYALMYSLLSAKRWDSSDARYRNYYILKQLCIKICKAARWISFKGHTLYLSALLLIIPKEDCVFQISLMALFLIPSQNDGLLEISELKRTSPGEFQFLV